MRLWRNRSPRTPRMGMWNGATALAASQMVKHRATPWTNYPTPRSFPREMKMYVPTKTCTNVHRSTIHDGQVETTQMAINWWINKQMRCIHTMEYYSYIKRSEAWHMLQHEWTLKTLCWVEEGRHGRPQCMISNIWSVQSRQSHRDRGRFMVPGAGRLWGDLRGQLRVWG